MAILNFPNTGLVANVTQYTSDTGTTYTWDGFKWSGQAPIGLTGVIVTSPQLGQVLKYNGTNWINDADSVSGGAGVGTVTNVSVTSANGFTGSVATSSSTPAITIGTSITGMLKGTSTAIAAATSGTDYQAPIGTISGLVKGNGANALTAAVAGTDYQSAQSVTGIVKSSGTTRSAATSGTDYAPGTSSLSTGIVKSTTTTGALTIAVADTDYQAPVSATGILKSSGVSGNVTAAIAGTDYQSAQSVTGIVKSSGTTRSAAVLGTDYAPGTSALTTGIVKSTTTTGALTIAVSGTDYQAPVSATGILKSSGVSGNVSAAAAGTDYQAPITLTTTGSSGAATFSSNTLNIPQYSNTRTTVNSTTASLANAATGNLTITGYKGYFLYKIQTSAAAWVRIYTDTASRTADAGRNELTDPTPGSGVIAEVITTGAQTILISPGAIGFSNEGTPSTNIELTVTNKSGGTTAITVTLTVLPLEA